MNLRDASAPVRAIKRLLSHHEIATLLLLLHAPIDVRAATPDVASLSEYGYVEMVNPEPGEAKFRLTADGNAVLRGLGIK
ncbi:hypothetical protein ASG35_17385 [Burkholderia sp. Leaf177]|uniref:hypothetical protein n=1 Tax=Burkholderia sp. Leaf177 TaxID=1736287 RepID=UPI0007014A9C|nr:hypothetical protein [Burkholderia sp. Leaf177]KQR74534.1 hypothetical protein ASG35_17385 [Burkholderia sp. Leaf177]